MTTSCRLLAFFGVMAISVWPSTGAAQGAPPATSAAAQTTEEKTAAELRTLFQEGLNHQKAGRWPEAERAYLAAWQKKKTHDIAANLGLVSVELKKYVQAAELFAYALRNYPAGGSPSKRADMEAAFKESKSHIGTLWVTATVEDAQIAVNGVDRGKSPLEGDVFVPPGPYVVSVRRVGYLEAEQKGTVDKGAVAGVSVVLVPEKAPAPAATSVPTGLVPPVVHPRTELVIGGTAIAGALVAVGAVMIGVAEKTRADLQSDAPRNPDGMLVCARDTAPGTSVPACEDFRSKLRDGNAFGQAGIGLLIGGALVGLATAGYVLLWPRTATSHKASVLPMITPTAGGLVWRGAF